MNVETHIGQYKIVRTLGAGGMGTVYLGEHLLLGRRAAIKTLLPSLSCHREIVERFFNEARAISAISDPGVVQIFDFGYHVDGTAYIVMEFLEGESLQTRIDRLGKLPLADALRIVRQIAASLAAAHARGIIHRDLKPGNVFVTRDSEAQSGERTKILDFGICKLSGSDLSRPDDPATTQTGVMLGTPVYMSPEQCRGSADVDQRSDIYSVGAALFHMLTGTTPFDCESVGDFIAAHLKEDPPAPSELVPELPPSVDAIVLRCLAKKPEDRFQTMRDLQGAVEDVLATLSDPGRLATAGPMNATPLSDGFHSAYDVNHGAPPATTGRRKSTKPSAGWFVDSSAPVGPNELTENDHEWVPPERGLSLGHRAALVMVLFVGLLGGLYVTSAALSGDDEDGVAAVEDEPTPATEPRAQPAFPTFPTEPAAAAAAPVAPAAGDGETVAGDQSIESELSADEPVKAPAAAPQEPAAKAANDAPTITKKPDRPRPARTPPIPRRRVQTEPEATKPEDDLYDTR